MAPPTAARSVTSYAFAAAQDHVPASRTQRVRGTFRGTSFDSAFERYVTASRTHDSMLLRIELSGFRSVEEQWGLRQTDELRDELVRRAIEAAGPLALAGRVGTNEIAVVLPLVEAGRALEEQLATIRGALEVQYEGCGAITANVGGVRFDRDLRDPAEIKLRAGMALHQATGSRAGRTVLYDTELHAQWDARAGLLDEIRRGAAAGEFVLHYQPICDLGGRGRGFEALMRWQHPDRGLLAPYHFLAAFEHPALSVVLGDVAIRTAVAQMQTWRDAGIDFGYVAVNLATEQFAVGDLAQRLHEVLQEYGMEPSCLMLEVTENVYLDRDADRIVATLRSLRALGVRVALDDFGTGFASLSHLKTLPIDRLKIDRAFVKGLQEHSIDAAIVGAMMLLGKSLGVEVVAEGVETEAELAALRALGCERIQGFLFSRPLDPQAAGQFLGVGAQRT